jgi:hypothetical protein
MVVVGARGADCERSFLELRRPPTLSQPHVTKQTTTEHFIHQRHEKTSRVYIHDVDS